ncbi:MAG: hypothetical protein LBJ48_07215 [Coriobacteriales bacterium]|jgi:hypothetical protein|nr:hypothetical protein [Coriobacteriales bacterium]
MSIANINIRTDSDIKSQAQQIFETLGLDITTSSSASRRSGSSSSSIVLASSALPVA